jgi:hypothetical protein
MSAANIRRVGGPEYLLIADLRDQVLDRLGQPLEQPPADPAEPSAHPGSVPKPEPGDEPPISPTDPGPPAPARPAPSPSPAPAPRSAPAPKTDHPPLSEQSMADPSKPEAPESDAPPTEPPLKDAPSIGRHHDNDFWGRSSTEDFVDVLANMKRVAIFAGADGAADVGEPIHRIAIAMAISRVLKDDVLAEELGSEAKRSLAVRDAAMTLLHSSLPTQQLGSILHSLIERDAYSKQANTYGALAATVERAVRSHRRAVSGFVSQHITRLALTLKVHQVDVVVLTTHFDTDLRDKQLTVRETASPNAPIRDVSYEEMTLEGLANWRVDAQRVPLVMLDNPLMFLGEAERLTNPGEAGQQQLARTIVRLGDVFEDRDVVFIGTSLDDPGLLTAAARSRYASKRRFALVLPPRDLPIHPDASVLPTRRPERPDPMEFSIRRAVFGERFRHLGISPVVADFHWEVPQVVYEATLKLDQPDDYQPYAARRYAWWKPRQVVYGGGQPPYPGMRRFRDRWNQRLEEVKEMVATKLLDREDLDQASERIEVDAWICKGNGRELFLWASSDDQAELADEPVIKLGAYTSEPAARAFRQGMQWIKTLDVSDDDPAQFEAPTPGPSSEDDPWTTRAIPLVLFDEPHHRLQVGVLTIRCLGPHGGSRIRSRSDDARNLCDVAAKMVLPLLLEEPETT